MTETVAVLDVGKTNKKVSLYDRAFQVLVEERATFAPRMLDGLEVEDTEGLLAWFRTALAPLSKEYAIRAIATCTHGATFALLDEAGKLAYPVISYTSERGAEVQEEFYEVFGSRDALHRATGTADLGFANMAKVLYLVKTRLPDVYRRCCRGLFYGPYFGYELSGALGLEPTYPGNHTYFWDFAKYSWSDVARQLGADRLFELPMRKSWDVLGPVKPDWAAQCGLPDNCVVTAGIHDSNANYLPYIAKGHSNFVLNSTGTWCVLMSNSDTLSLTDDEIRAKVFFNQDTFGRPVRTSVSTLGLDYDAFMEFTNEKDSGNLAAAQRVVSERELFVVPGVLPGASAFTGQPARVVNADRVEHFEELRNRGGKPFTPLGQAYCVAVNLGLAIASARLLRWCGIRPGTTVFIEGGFAKNKTYCGVLAALCPEQSFALTSLKEGTSFGTALTAWMAADKRSLEDIGASFAIETTPAQAAELDNLRAYVDDFDTLVS